MSKMNLFEKREGKIYIFLTLFLCCFFLFLVLTMTKREYSIEKGDITSAVVIKKQYTKLGKKIYIEYFFLNKSGRYIGTVSYNNHEDDGVIISLGDTIPIKYNPIDPEQSIPFFDSILKSTRSHNYEMNTSLDEMLKSKPSNWSESFKQ